MTKSTSGDKGRRTIRLAGDAGRLALDDSGVDYGESIRHSSATCYGDSTAGHGPSTAAGSPGILVVNVNNNCSTRLQRPLHGAPVDQGRPAECAPALGPSRVELGSLGVKFTDRVHPSTSTCLPFSICASGRTPPARHCSARLVASTWSDTAPRRITSPGSG